MAKTVYALLVGINEYPNPDHRLDGCINDIKAVEEYLRGRIAKDKFDLKLKVLKNDQAKRQSVIEGFQEHLAKADADDVAFFYFSGHGARWPTAPEFLPLEPDGLDEALVCWDSRLNDDDPRDLADKEIAALIAQVAAGGAHVVLVLDCCHSHSANRDLGSTKVRRIATPKEPRPRPLSSYIVTPEQLGSLPVARALDTDKNKWFVPLGRHVLLAACRSDQGAYEYIANKRKCGAFTHFLLDTLERSSTTPTYRNLLKRTVAMVKGNVTDQWPQLDVTNSEDMDRPFLGGAVTARMGNFLVTHDKEHGWVVDAGSVHGIGVSANGETTVFALFLFDATVKATGDLSQSIGQAKVVAVFPQSSKVDIEGIDHLSDEKAYKAVVVSLPMPPLGVMLEGSDKGIGLIREAINSGGPNGRPSLFVCEDQADPVFRLVARKEKRKGEDHGEDSYLIFRPADDSPLVAPIKGYTEAGAELAVKRLEHIARWKNIVDLDNRGSQIKEDAIKMTIMVNNEEINDAELRLKYTVHNKQLIEPTFKVKLKNNGTRDYYCALLFLSQEFEVSAEAFAAGGVLLKPGEEAWAMSGNPIYVSIPPQMRKAGITQYVDILKLIVCTTQFDGWAMEQEKLEGANQQDAVNRRGATIRQKTTLNRLMDRTRTRAMSSRPESDETYSDWTTNQISVTTVLP